eukprot:5080310-Pyramimonas_sp.AAC.1
MKMIVPKQPRSVLLAGLASDVYTMRVVADDHIMMRNASHATDHVTRLRRRGRSAPRHNNG